VHQYYADILALTDKEPLWFDECGVPRFTPFSPVHLNNIYAQYAVLLLIECQACRMPFQVALTERSQSTLMPKDRCRSMHEHIRGGTVHYGDPPNIQCCEAGPTMNSVPRRVIEYWTRTERGQRALLESISTDASEEEQLAVWAAMPAAILSGWDRDSTLEIEVGVPWA